MTLKLLKSDSDSLKGSPEESGKKRKINPEESGKKRKRCSESSASSNLISRNQKVPVEMSSMTKCQWSAGELILGKRVLKEYSTNMVHYNNEGDYWNPQIWLEFRDRYNYLAHASQLPLLTPTEFRNLGRLLQSEYCVTRSRYKSYGHSDMEEVFSPCPACQRRIPVFPKYLPDGANSYSNTNSGTRGNESNEQELNSHGGQLKVVVDQLTALWLGNNLTNKHICKLLEEPKLRAGTWYNLLIDDKIPDWRKSSLLTDNFCGGASTYGQ